MVQCKTVQRRMLENIMKLSSTVPSRYLLFQLSENITKDDMKCFKFLLGKELPKCKLSPETVRIVLFCFIFLLFSFTSLL